MTPEVTPVSPQSESSEGSSAADYIVQLKTDLSDWRGCAQRLRSLITRWWYPSIQPCDVEAACAPPALLAQRGAHCKKYSYSMLLCQGAEFTNAVSSQESLENNCVVSTVFSPIIHLNNKALLSEADLQQKADLLHLKLLDPLGLDSKRSSSFIPM